MKTLLLLFAGLSFGLATASAQAAPSRGTLTLEAGKVVFRNAGTETTYSLDRVPGLRAVGYERNVLVSNGEETDVSELRLENALEEPILLVAGKQIEVLYDAETNLWTLVKQR